MSELLEQAVNKLKSLPKQEQDTVASLILHEIEDEQNWNQSFSKSLNVLAKMSERAMMEYRAGLTEELDVDKL